MSTTCWIFPATGWARWRTPPAAKFLARKTARMISP
nr:MAG TPA: hypothetical protein [Caudoviricetes sp.]